MSTPGKPENMRMQELQEDTPSMEGQQPHIPADVDMARVAADDTVGQLTTSNGSTNVANDVQQHITCVTTEEYRVSERAPCSPRITPQPSRMIQTQSETMRSITPPSISITDLSKSLAGGVEDGGLDVGLQDDSNLTKRKRAGEESDSSLNVRQSTSASSKLGILHSRRKKASPQKFNTGHFDPSPINIHDKAEPPSKRLRYENQIKVSYDSVGTPRIASITPILASSSSSAFPHSPRISATPHLTPAGQGPTKKFSLLYAICCRNDLLLELVSFLPFSSLLKLYCISKHFHALFNRHHTAFILANMRTWAPDADRIYPWRCYKSLCVKDPVRKQKSSYQVPGVELKLDKKYQDLRDVPSLRWLQMVIWRHGVCKDILILLATKALRCPPGTLDAIQRLWFIMDLPLNTMRIACMRSTTYLTNQHIYIAQTFFLKVDMAFTSPAGQITAAAAPGATPAQQHLASRGFVGCSLRALLTAERHFTSLWRVLRGWSWDSTKLHAPMSRIDVLRLWVRHRYHPPPNTPAPARKLPILDIPWYEVGTASLERTGVSILDLDGKTQVVMHPSLTSAAAASNPNDHVRQQLLYPHRKRLLLPSDKPRETLLRPEQLVLREGIRRQMSLHTQWVRMMLYGFVDEVGREYRVLSEAELVAWDKGKRPGNVFLPSYFGTEEGQGLWGNGST